MNAPGFFNLLGKEATERYVKATRVFAGRNREAKEYAVEVDGKLVWSGKPASIAGDDWRSPVLPGLKAGTKVSVRVRALPDGEWSKPKKFELPMLIRPPLIPKKDSNVVVIPSPPVDPVPPTDPTPEPEPTPVTPELVGMVPFGVHLDRADVVSTDAYGTGLHSTLWDFDDDAGRYNNLRGVNASHRYNAAGDFLITAATPGYPTRTYAIRATPDTRVALYVSAAGNDANDGATPETAVRTWGRALARWAALGKSAVKICFRRGDTFTVTQSFKVEAADVWVTAYGTGDAPALMTDVSATPSLFVFDLIGSTRFVADNLTFDATGRDLATEALGRFEKDRCPVAFRFGGVGPTVGDCTLRCVNSGIVGEGRPVGWFVYGLRDTSITSIRGYGVVGEGTNGCVVDCDFRNSTREHTFRFFKYSRATVSFCRSANLDRTKALPLPDPGDGAKSGYNFQVGEYGGLYDSVARGANNFFAPLGSGETTTRLKGMVVDRCRFVDSRINVGAGTEGMAIVDTLVQVGNDFGIGVESPKAPQTRKVKRLAIRRTTVAGTTASSTGIWVQSGVSTGADGVTLDRFYFHAPLLWAGGSGEPCGIKLDNAACLAASSGNAWSVAARTSVGTRVNRINGSYAERTVAPFDADAYVTPAAGVFKVGDAGCDPNLLPAEVV